MKTAGCIDGQTDENSDEVQISPTSWTSVWDAKEKEKASSCNTAELKTQQEASTMISMCSEMTNSISSCGLKAINRMFVLNSIFNKQACRDLVHDPVSSTFLFQFQQEGVLLLQGAWGRNVGVLSATGDISFPIGLRVRWKPGCRGEERNGVAVWMKNRRKKYFNKELQRKTDVLHFHTPTSDFYVIYRDFEWWIVYLTQPNHLYSAPPFAAVMTPGLNQLCMLETDNVSSSS